MSAVECERLWFERESWARGYVRVAGIDEAGRGPLAGPVVAAAVVFEKTYLESECYGCLAGLTDSKKLSEKKREFFYSLLTASAHVEIGVASRDREEIDRINILRATHLAMKEAVQKLRVLPEHALIDGLSLEGIPCSCLAIIGGDGRSLSIAAASVVAKVTRDRIMRDMDRIYPQYGFAQHKGYGTRRHIQALLEYGPCPIHRRSFQPVKDAEEIQERERGTDAAARALDTNL